MVSLIFSVYLAAAIFRDGIVPEFVRGLRYIVTCGLMATMFIYVVLLSSNSKNVMTEEDFVSGISPKTANFVLHYFCPLVSLLSFLLFGRQIVFTTLGWTGYVAIPSCLYWVIYIILFAAHLWEEPYDFTTPKGKGKNMLREAITMISIPISFVLFSYILWQVK